MNLLAIATIRTIAQCKTENGNGHLNSNNDLKLAYSELIRTTLAVPKRAESGAGAALPGAGRVPKIAPQIVKLVSVDSKGEGLFSVSG